MIIKRICYLCGKAIEDKTNKDHVISKHLIKGQPKKKGFDYAGFIETHPECNSKFGDLGSNLEALSPKALRLLKILYDDHTHPVTRVDNPDIVLLPIRSKYLDGFTKRDFRIFGLTDFTQKKYEDFSNPESYKGKEKINPYEKPINVALSVLAKNVAALLFKRESFYPIESWNIFSAPFRAYEEEEVDILLNGSKSFDVGVKVKVEQNEHGDWVCVLKIERFYSFIIFTKSYDFTVVNYFIKALPREINFYRFHGPKLTDLVGYNWIENKF